MAKTYYLDEIFKKGHKTLLHSQEALGYLSSRGVTKNQIQDLKLGFVPEDSWPLYIDTETATSDELFYWKRSGHGVKLKGKLLFPMTNAMGLIRGLQVRSPDPETKDYWKFYSERSDIDALFFGTNVAMPHIWEKQSVYLVEGIFDLFPVLDIFPNTLCCGTAKVASNQIKFLQRHVDSVKIMFDNDEYGERFFHQFYKKYKHDFTHIERVSYAGKDPSESWKRLGPDSFRNQFSSELFMDLDSLTNRSLYNK